MAFPQALARYDGVTAVTQEWAGTRVEDGIKASRRVANRTVSPPASLVGGLQCGPFEPMSLPFPKDVVIPTPSKRGLEFRQPVEAKRVGNAGPRGSMMDCAHVGMRRVAARR